MERLKEQLIIVVRSIILLVSFYIIDWLWLISFLDSVNYYRIRWNYQMKFMQLNVRHYCNNHPPYPKPDFAKGSDHVSEIDCIVKNGEMIIVSNSDIPTLKNIK